MNNISLSVTRALRQVGEPRRALFTPRSVFFQNHADAQFFNRINSLEPIAPQSSLTAFNRITNLQSIASQLSAQNLCESTQILRGSTQKHHS
jgi:hypothetical protein